MQAEPIDERPEGSNPSRNPALAELIEKRMDRRSLLQGAAALTATQFLAGGVLAGRASAAPSGGWGGPLLGFSEVPPSDADTIVVPPGYSWEVLLPWGTPLLPGAPAFLEDASNSSVDQELQVGFNHDGLHYFPLGPWPFASKRGLLVMNHEYTDANQIYSAAQGSAITPDAAGKEKVAKAFERVLSRAGVAKDEARALLVAFSELAE